MISIRSWGKSGEEFSEIEPSRFVLDSVSASRLVWIDLVGDETAEHQQFLQDQLGLDKLAIEDAMRHRHPPKFEILEDGLNFLLMRGFDAASTSVKFGTIQLAMFWRGNLVVTRHAKPSASISEVQTALANAEQPAPADAWRLLYAILRRLLDRYLPILLKIEARLEEIEELILKRPSDRLLAELMEFSSQLKRLRRIGAYHEKCFASLRTHDPKARGIHVTQLTDLFEQAERLHSLATLQYEMTADLTNGYLSVSAHRLNNVMRVLTVVTVLFVPLTFIAGIYGMNFEFMPELQWRWSYFIVLGSMASVAIGLLIVFRRRGWI
ncbi:MAG TPA: magnesium/cobalt transporter CorA [Dokdonella sp.]|uniref:magnesium/cobalt transporter CorA n=1 Tax=Dokdonella sp. TaxID=2291710 RepID=UPI002D7FE169|nr:magnesium/cobalt transporter CorA [Dokdonella sp.]HET9034124.1 magnesium/cobalt transporter CorA [Dokdonella sp.]